MSLFDKFRVDPSEDHGGRLFSFAPTDPVPIRANARPLLNEHEAERLEPVSDGYVKLFDVSDTRDRLELQIILTRAFKGWYVIGHIQRNYLPEKGTVIVYCEWYQLYNEVPKALEDRVFADEGIRIPLVPSASNGSLNNG